MRHAPKKAFPVEDARQILEPGPIVLVSCAHEDKRNVMTMGWHTVMEFTPSLFGCVIAASNHSFGMIRGSGECAINVPDADMVDTVVGIGNCSGAEIDKFEKFDLTPVTGKKVKAPLIAECFASFECKIHDHRLVDDYNFFILEIVAAHVAASPKHPNTLHYCGKGIFTDDGKVIDRHEDFTKWKNQPNF